MCHATCFCFLWPLNFALSSFAAIGVASLSLNRLSSLFAGTRKCFTRAKPVPVWFFFPALRNNRWEGTLGWKTQKTASRRTHALLFWDSVSDLCSVFVWLHHHHSNIIQWPNSRTNPRFWLHFCERHYLRKSLKSWRIMHHYIPLLPLPATEREKVSNDAHHLRVLTNRQTGCNVWDWAVLCLIWWCVVHELYRELCYLHSCSSCTPQTFSTTLSHATYRNSLMILQWSDVLVMGRRRSGEH